MESISVVPSIDSQVLRLNFLLTDCPPVEKLDEYAEYFRQHNVVLIVRICESSWYDAKTMLGSLYAKYTSNDTTISYDTSNPLFLRIKNSCIGLCDEVHFEDGGVPTMEMVDHWLDIVESIQRSAGISEFLAATNSSGMPSIAVHCVSGLGRAPILIAIAILEYFPDMDVLDGIQWLRQYRKGALNSRQIEWLESDYDRKHRRKNYKRRKSRFDAIDETCLQPLAKKERKKSVIERMLSSLSK